MKRIVLSSLLALCSVFAEAKFAPPFGSIIYGAGSTEAVASINAIIAKYNKIFPCPKFVYLQSPSSKYAGSANGVNRVLDDSVTFAISEGQISASAASEASDCLLEIPFISTTLVVIYHLPFSFPGINFNASWPGHLNISPADLCLIYTGGSLGWAQLAGRPYNGSQGYGNSQTVLGYITGASAPETALFVNYLRCSIPTPTGTCATFLNASNVISNPQGPFCGTTPGAWGPNVTCFNGFDAVANAVAATLGGPANEQGVIGIVPLEVAIAHGFFPSPPVTSGPAAQVFPGYLGVAGLYNGVGSSNSVASYVLPTVTACVQSLCATGEYPLTQTTNFVLYATQPANLIACNIAQFIQFAVNEGPKILGNPPLTSNCLEEAATLIDKIASEICDPCVEPCNPCLNQPCPLPCAKPCA